MDELQPPDTPPTRMALWGPVGLLVVVVIFFVVIFSDRHGDAWDYAFLSSVALLCVGRISRYRKARASARGPRAEGAGPGGGGAEP